MSTTVKIKEHSWLAFLAARYLRATGVAMVIWRTIYLYNTTRAQFLRNTGWVCHELVHVKQWQQYGRVRFLVLYLRETFTNGYFNNRFEAEARQQENNAALLRDFTFV